MPKKHHSPATTGGSVARTSNVSIPEQSEKASLPTLASEAGNLTLRIDESEKNALSASAVTA